GIRAFHVTGVQTCALPICCLPVVLGVYPGGDVPEPVQLDAAHVPAWLAGVVQAGLEDPTVHPQVEQVGAHPAPVDVLRVRHGDEIGRASCRERAEGGRGRG